MARQRWVRNVFGEKREITRRWESGHVACPYCSGSFKPRAGCGNPACEANPSVTLAVAQARRERYEAEQRERDSRARAFAIRWST